MVFSSFAFAAFLLVVYIAYLAASRNFRLQNMLLLVASYVFYGWWDWRFVFLLFGSTLAAYLAARWIENGFGSKRVNLIAALVINLGALAFFKYFNFFTGNVESLLGVFGMGHYDFALQIILPVGISFYIFQNLSYVIDVYMQRYKAEHRFAEYALYVSFFPQLVAGPIERADNMLPQFNAPRRLDPQQTLDGLTLIAWGLFKKIVIADYLAAYVDPVFADPTSDSGFGLTFAVIAFTFQIYCDFSAYSDIARGVAKLFGLELMLNFALPYIARSPREFWRRWHISLSTWIRDYVYKPLGGNRGSDAFIVRNLMITMLLGGLWHGAAWNFVLWGGYHGALQAIQHLYTRARERRGHAPVRMDDAGWGWIAPLQIVGMFILTVYGWILFRAESFWQIVYFSTNLGLDGIGAFGDQLLRLAVFVLAIAIFDGYFVRRYTADRVEAVKPIFAVAGSAILILVMMVYGVREATEFIYFQF